MINFIEKRIKQSFKAATYFFILSTLFFAYGMKKISQNVNEYDDVSNKLEKCEINIIDTCICEKKILEEEISIEEAIIHAINHNCTFCLNFHFSHNNWDINHKLFAHNNHWKTPLLYACQQGSLEAMKTISTFNPEFTLNFLCGIKWSATHFAAFSDNDTHDIIEILLAHNVNIDEQTKRDIQFLNLTVTAQ